MQHTHNTLALHINDLTINDLEEVRQALQWFAHYIAPVHAIHLLHCRLRLPAQALCLSTAEHLYCSEYQTAEAQLVVWRDLLCIPQCTGWLHEGMSRFDIKSFCHQHQFDYLLTTNTTAESIGHTKRHWRRANATIVEQFSTLSLLALQQPTITIDKNQHENLSLAVGYP